MGIFGVEVTWNDASANLGILKSLTNFFPQRREGKSATLVENEATLTPVEAAKLLGVWRQFLLGEVDRRMIPDHTAGTHARPVPVAGSRRPAPGSAPFASRVSS